MLVNEDRELMELRRRVTVLEMGLKEVVSALDRSTHLTMGMKADLVAKWRAVLSAR